LCLLALQVFPPAAAGQVVTPKGRVAPVYRADRVDSGMIAQVEADGRWRLDFHGAEVAAPLPGLSRADVRYLLPARDNGRSLLARVQGPGRNDNGWIEPASLEISPERFWKIPRASLLFVPMRERQVPPLVSASLEVAPKAGRSYLLLIDPDGRVIDVAPLVDYHEKKETEPDPAIEAALKQWQFTPSLLEGEPVHMVLGISISAAR